MVKEVKVNGMESFSAALIKMKKGTAPEITSGDDGKILTASYDAEAGGSTSWEDAPNGVPEVTSGDGGKVLTAAYNAETGGSASWQDPPESVPEVTSVDAGKVLTAHYTQGVGGSMSWDAPEAPVSLVIDDDGTTNHIGDLREHSGNNVIVHPIVSKMIAASGTWGYTNVYGPMFKLSDCYKILSVTVFGTWTYGDVMEKVNVFYDPNEDGGTWKSYRTGNALVDISVSGVLVEYAQTVS